MYKDKTHKCLVITEQPHCNLNGILKATCREKSWEGRALAIYIPTEVYSTGPAQKKATSFHSMCRLSDLQAAAVFQMLFHRSSMGLFILCWLPLNLKTLSAFTARASANQRKAETIFTQRELGTAAFLKLLFIIFISAWIFPPSVSQLYSIKRDKSRQMHVCKHDTKCRPFLTKGTTLAYFLLIIYGFLNMSNITYLAYPFTCMYGKQIFPFWI